MRYLDRFVEAHELGDPAPYSHALREIRQGRKESHWMWYIFPQLRDLGRSSRAYIYGIVDLAEAKEYLQDPYLGGHLREITAVLLQLEENDPVKIFGGIDAQKLCSSMTLFSLAEGEDSVYGRVLAKYYRGQKDPKTLRLLGVEEA